MKEIYTSEDISILGWHDSKIYALAFDETTFKFYLDIDIILEWIESSDSDEGYMFKVAPATLVFENVWDLALDIETNLALEIDDFSMQNPHLPRNKDILPDVLEYDCSISLQQGEISFKSIGFALHLKTSPVVTQQQFLGLNKRGGISFLLKNTQTM